MKKLIVVLYLLYSYASANACGNMYYTLTRPDGSTFDMEEGVYYKVYELTNRFKIKELSFDKSQTEKALQKDPDNYQLLSDYSLILLKMGETDRSLNILRKLFKSHPEEYNILANLGTAYELAEKPDSALLILKQAVQINPGSHEGSEWIHLRILEAKLKKKQDPNYTLKDHSIIGFNIESVPEFYKYYAKQPKAYQDSLRLLAKQLRWQLEERTDFVEPYDIYVSSLLFDLANLVAVTQSIEGALPFYELALVYEPDDDLGIRETYGALLPLSKKPIAQEDTGIHFSNTDLIIGFLIIFLPILIFIVILIIKKKKATRYAK